ncbi:MAG TPA: penicillin-binding transpeptidase domain-containing protein [Terracidiphilus sp.]|nr:penicillin-binding transpeptidase domain-containing protein [Terracidiphilus sp.]
MQATLRAVRPRTTLPRTIPMNRSRFWLICLFFAFWACAIAARLFWLQVLDHKEYMERAERQQERTFEVAPRRGILFDRNMREMAMTVQVDSIYAVPTEIDDKAAAARRLAAIVHVDPDDTRTTAKAIEERLEHGRSFAWVARRVKAPVAARVRALGMEGIYFQKEFQRFYPDNQLAAQVLGYVGLDDNGLGGLEQKFNARLHGKPGVMFTAVDARRQVLGSTEHDPEPGQNLQLTIDENIQFMAEQALDHAMAKTHALHGTVVIQDVHTGQILALAVRPTYDPNDFRHTNPDLLRDRAVSDVYEPGSTFKLVTYAAALEEHLITPETMINCLGGQINLYGHIIHDDKSDRGIGTVTAAMALARSSDVGVIKVAQMLGPQRLYNYIRAFGFGQRSGIELPAETRGLLRPVKYWQPASIGYVAMGQEEAVTPVQLVSMVSTIANGGEYLPPHILVQGQLEAKAGQDPALHAEPVRADEDMSNPLPAGARRVISTMAAAQMRQMMEGVVLYGTGKTAQLDGYSSAGKTGTAQKIDPETHRYSKSLHIASFAGFAPVNNPAIAVAVVIDSPKGDYYGTTVAAPVFTEVAQEVLEYLGVPHDIAVRPDKAPRKETAAVSEDDTESDQQNMDALFAAANNLPPDDPLRAAATEPEASRTDASSSRQQDAEAPQASAAPDADSHVNAPAAAPGSAQKSAQVTLHRAEEITVPSFVGLSLRRVIETAAAARLDVKVVGDGTAREQAPKPGTRVSAGTKIVVKCTR